MGYPHGKPDWIGLVLAGVLIRGNPVSKAGLSLP